MMDIGRAMSLLRRTTTDGAGRGHARDEDLVELLSMRSKCLLSLGAPSEALKDISRALTMEPNNKALQKQHKKVEKILQVKQRWRRATRDHATWRFRDYVTRRPNSRSGKRWRRRQQRSERRL